MATTTITRRQRTATPARWQQALARALAEGVEVRQLAGSGMWIATSGTDTTTAYEVSQFGCSCPAGEFGDPVCKHRAAYWHALGVLDLDDEPEPPTPAAPAACPVCGGRVWCPCPACGEDGADAAPAATAAQAVARIERMAAPAGDAPADLPWAA